MSFIAPLIHRLRGRILRVLRAHDGEIHTLWTTWPQQRERRVALRTYVASWPEAPVTRINVCALFTGTFRALKIAVDRVQLLQRKCVVCPIDPRGLRPRRLLRDSRPRPTLHSLTHSRTSGSWEDHAGPKGPNTARCQAEPSKGYP